ncbi:hypothetical protein CEXT_387221 [Caerostris extrusa]|uniref:Uncharacterized protein n=1 Tax=Caerostris extrusa TaxID=172846 RepID=A0AAV4RCF0_CAEEX|nr:hypothetical protein CEXT_387221 [Caerostris extrusa]
MTLQPEQDDSLLNTRENILHPRDPYLYVPPGGLVIKSASGYRGESFQLTPFYKDLLCQTTGAGYHLIVKGVIEATVPLRPPLSPRPYRGSGRSISGVLPRNPGSPLVICASLPAKDLIAEDECDCLIEGTRIEMSRPVCWICSADGRALPLQPFSQKKKETVKDGKENSFLRFVTFLLPTVRLQYQVMYF